MHRQRFQFSYRRWKVGASNQTRNQTLRQPVPPQKRLLAKSLRLNATPAERRLWQLLRAKQLEDLKFKRQVPLDGYVADFVCFEARLIIEADGGQHSGSVHDQKRDAHFAARNFKTLRLWNNDITQNPEGVIAEILRVAKSRIES